MRWGKHQTIYRNERKWKNHHLLWSTLTWKINLGGDIIIKLKDFIVSSKIAVQDRLIVLKNKEITNTLTIEEGLELSSLEAQLELLNHITMICDTRKRY